MQKKREHPSEKVKLHLRNQHRKRYDFKLLCKSFPELTKFIQINKYGDESINFFNPEAVIKLNTALLLHFYGIKNWSIPKDYLCPPVPGRADYIHYIADLLAESFGEKTPTGSEIRGLDIGVGANCIYPIIGSAEYQWSFVGTDIDVVAIDSAQKVVDANDSLKGKIDLRWQENSKHIFVGIIQEQEIFDFTICNPPFHSSAAEAQSGTRRKLVNLKHKKGSKTILNFGGQNNELWCEGGEQKFISELILESKLFAHKCLWFTTLVSKQSNLIKIYKVLKSVAAVDVKTIKMGQGNKISRIVAWSFLNKIQQKDWWDKK